MKDSFIKIRISDKEKQVLNTKNNKSEYIRNLILHDKPTDYDLIIELSLLWEELKNSHVDTRILEKLKNIIMGIKDDSKKVS
jgi:hypothetical protein